MLNGMFMMKLGGWTRIGIVISIIWSVIIFGYVVSEYHSMSAESGKIIITPGMLYSGSGMPGPDTHPIFFEWVYPADFRLNINLLLSVWILPMLLMWTLPAIAVKTIVWIKKGFSSSDAS